MKTIDERVLEVLRMVDDDFINDTIAFTKNENGEEEYRYNYTYCLGRLSALYLTAVGFETMNEVLEVREIIQEQYHKTVEWKERQK